MGLLGKADPTLVKGAAIYAQANIPGDMSAIYTKREATQKKWAKFAQELQTAWDNKDIEWNNDLAEIEKQSGEAIINQTKGKKNSAAMQLVSDIVTDRTNYYKSFKNNRNSIEEKKIQGELTQFANTIKLNSERYSRMINGDFIIQGTGDEIKLWSQIMKDYNLDTNVSNLQYNDSDIVYTYGDLSMTLAELENKLVTRDSTPGTAVQKTINEVTKGAAKTNRPNDDNYKADVKGRVKEIIRKRKDRINVMHTWFDGLGGSTFFEALTGKDKGLQEQIYNTLENLSGIGLDLNKDNIKDSEVDELGIPNFDYTTAENAVLLQEAILDSPYSIEIVSNFVVDNMFDYAYGIGKLDNKNTISEKGKRGGGGGAGIITSKEIKRSKVPYTDITGRKTEMWSTDIQNLSNQLAAMVNVKSGTKIANIGLGQYTYIKGKGYVRASKHETHGKIMIDRDSKTKIPIGGYFPTIDDVFTDQGIPLGYSGGQSTSGKEQITW